MNEAEKKEKLFDTCLSFYRENVWPVFPEIKLVSLKTRQTKFQTFCSICLEGFQLKCDPIRISFIGNTVE